MRKMTLFSDSACAKFGCAREHVPASVRPAIVYKSCTPPSAGPNFFPFVVTNRASRTGPASVMKEGTMLVAPSRVARPTCGLGIGVCGLVRPGLLPPMAGYPWHIAQLLPLNAGPRPFPFSSVSPPETESVSINRINASLKYDCSFEFNVK
jgi:hypothetical protein